MRTLTLNQPRRLVFGKQAEEQCIRDLTETAFAPVLILSSPSTLSFTSGLQTNLRRNGRTVEVYSEIDREPSVKLFTEALQFARHLNPGMVIGVGGGSVLDVAKLIAVQIESDQETRDLFGVGLLKRRGRFLVCLPTTAGTGSEVSPNAILLDEEEQLKKGVVSPFLVPDAAYIDPRLTLTVPPQVTAATGLDALTHCMEAYTNRFSHPTISLLALEGIRLISQNLPGVVENGQDLDKREQVALGSLYGGLSLGPVNTAAVHALAYPLGGEFHVAHGLSNAVLLPHVTEFNIPSKPGAYAEIAVALGAAPGLNDEETAYKGIEKLQELFRSCGIAASLAGLGISEEMVPALAQASMKVTRLLKNNPRQLTRKDAEAIYRAACSP